MITKQCQFAGRDTNGEYIHILRAGYDNAGLVKEASSVATPPQLGVVQRFMKGLPKVNGKLYTLISALGAGEYWGSNSNADYFGEEPLLHTPPGWNDLPHSRQIAAGKRWEWGYPTFYNAHAFSHHQNKDPNRAFGAIEYATWDALMKRVLLIVAFDRARAKQSGSVGTIDRVENGEFPPVSMGCFPAETPILMADGGEAAIETILEDAAVKTHRGQNGRVAQTHRRRYVGVLYDVKVHGHRRRLRLTDEHPLLVVGEEQLRCRPSGKNHNRGRRMRQCTPATKAFSKGCTGCERVPSFKPDWVRADELQVGDRLLFPIPELVDPTLDDPKLVELLGYYLAEGFIHNYNKHENAAITFCLSEAKQHIVERILELREHFDVAAYSTWDDGRDSKSRYLSLLGCEKLAALCKTHCGKYAKLKHLSSQIMHMAPDFQKIFLGAYWEGDGGYYTGRSTGLYFSTASEELANQLFVVLARCGVIASVNRIPHKPSAKSVVRTDTVEFQVWVGKQFVHVLAPYCGIESPKLKAVKPLRFFFDYEGARYIASPVEEVLGEEYDGEVYNFAVDGDDSYVAAHLAVHNCRVPFDLCNYCFDFSKYRHLMNRPAQLVAMHKQKPIQGLSTETGNYCYHLKNELNKIYPDGRKVMMMNMHPRFFDLSLVFIGADKTSFILAKLAGECPVQPGSKACGGCRHTDCVSSAHVAEVWDRSKVAMEKKAQGIEEFEWEDPKTEKRINAYLQRKRRTVGRIKTSALDKRSEIIKQIQSHFRRNLPTLQREEPDMPRNLQDALSERMSDGLSTAGSLGIVAKPREFQRMYVRAIGRPGLADRLDDKRLMFGTGAPPAGDFRLSSRIIPKILSALLPLMRSRSAMTPSIGRRMVITIKCRPRPDVEEERGCVELDHPLMDKISSAYSAYRRDLLYKSAGLIKQAVFAHPEVHHALHGDDVLERGLVKEGADVVESVVGMLTSTYLNEAYLNEPVSEFVELNCNLAGLERASGLAILGGVA